MFKTLPSEAEQAAMVDAICGIDPNAGAVILADQTLRDLRPIIPSLALPHLLVWGTDEGVIKQASGTWLAENLPSERAARLRGQRPLPDVGGVRALQRARRTSGSPGSAAEQARDRLVVARARP